MPLYTKDSLDHLRQRIDLVEVVGSYLTLKRAGSTYKALCPFHEEKTPSFMIQKGDNHYHCFGCGAHGDAIAFLMNFQKMGFIESIEALAEKFGVVLETVGPSDHLTYKEGSRAVLRQAVDLACQLYHFLLLYAEEAEPALEYLYQRGIDLEFIKRFQLGYAPKDRKTIQKWMHSKGFSDEVLEKAGLITVSIEKGKKDFFFERITFPIRDSLGNAIGFSARKFREETFGGKYVNTPETPLFKKSQVLFGLSYSRPRMMKEKKAMIVEGQIDCLKLIHHGFDWTVAGQGTAFGEGHVKELLQLDIQSVYLALDGDVAGEEAAVKIGDLFQRAGIHVRVLRLEKGEDPDSILRTKGPVFFETLIHSSFDYLSFLVDKMYHRADVKTPAGKNQVVQALIERIRSWNKPVLVHESLIKLSELLNLPPEVIHMGSVPSLLVKKEGRTSKEYVDADKILEIDLIRLLMFSQQASKEIALLCKKNLKTDQLKIGSCKKLYDLVINTILEQGHIDLLSFGAALEKEEEEEVIVEIMKRKINPLKALESAKLAVKKILDRNWLEEREHIRQKIHSGALSEEEALELAKQFDELKKKQPELII